MPSCSPAEQSPTCFSRLLKSHVAKILSNTLPDPERWFWFQMLNPWQGDLQCLPTHKSGPQTHPLSRPQAVECILACENCFTVTLCRTMNRIFWHNLSSPFSLHTHPLRPSLDWLAGHEQQVMRVKGVCNPLGLVLLFSCCCGNQCSTKSPTAPDAVQ